MERGGGRDEGVVEVTSYGLIGDDDSEETIECCDDSDDDTLFPSDECDIGGG